MRSSGRRKNSWSLDGVQSLPRFLIPPRETAPQANAGGFEQIRGVAPMLHRHLGGLRRRVGVIIGNQVGDGNVHFMPDTGYYRNRTSRNRPGNNLLVEFPQILQRSTATR